MEYDKIKHQLMADRQYVHDVMRKWLKQQVPRSDLVVNDIVVVEEGPYVTVTVVAVLKTWPPSEGGG